MTSPQPTDGTTTTLSDTDFTVPIGDRYFEDYTPGAVHEYGYIVVTEQAILEFAQRWDQATYCGYGQPSSRRDRHARRRTAVSSTPKPNCSTSTTSKYCTYSP